MKADGGSCSRSSSSAGGSARVVKSVPIRYVSRRRRHLRWHGPGLATPRHAPRPTRTVGRHPPARSRSVRVLSTPATIPRHLRHRRAGSVARARRSVTHSAAARRGGGRPGCAGPLSRPRRSRDRLGRLTAAVGDRARCNGPTGYAGVEGWWADGPSGGESLVDGVPGILAIGHGAHCATGRDGFGGVPFSADDVTGFGQAGQWISGMGDAGG